MHLKALVLVLAVFSASSAVAADPISIAVMEFTSKGGVTQDQMDALSDMLSNQIRTMGNFKVIGKSDIRSMLTMEEQRQRLSTCSDQSCLAEIGGALGARWVVVGNVSLFGKTYLLNLKLIDVEGASVASGVSRSITGGEDKLLAELPGAAQELFDAVADRFQATAKEGVQPEEKKVVEKKEEHRNGVVKKEKKKKEEEKEASQDQRGKWGLWVTASGAGFSVVSDQEDSSFTCATNDIKGGRIGFAADLSGGYSINRWLALIGRVGGYYALGTREGAARYRYSIDVGLGLKVSIPLDSWIEPVAEGTVGVDFMHDDNRDDGSSLVPIDGIGLVLDTSIGADFYFTAAWFLGLRGGVTLRHYFQLEDNGQSTNAQSTVLGLFGAVTSGWRF
jgi:TolB-like protein